MKTEIDVANRILFIAAIEVRSGEEQYITYRLVPDALDERDAEERVLEYFRGFWSGFRPNPLHALKIQKDTLIIRWNL